MSLDQVTTHGAEVGFFFNFLFLSVLIQTAHVREGHLPLDVGKGRLRPHDYSRDQGGLSRLPYGKRDKRAGFFK